MMRSDIGANRRCEDTIRKIALTRFMIWHSYYDILRKSINLYKIFIRSKFIKKYVEGIKLNQSLFEQLSLYPVSLL